MMADRHRVDVVDEALDFAARKLQFGTFKSQQSTALRHIAQGNDLFVNLPTGFGKSVIFQAAPVVLDKLRGVVVEDESDGNNALVVVILPLKALAVDQLQRAEQLGIKAADITSSDIPDSVLEECQKYSVLFASPESLFSPKGTDLLQLIKGRCCGIFVDESHCVAKWGHASGQSSAFRKLYGQIGELRSSLQSSTFMVALTATATLKVRKIITKSLAMRNFKLVEESPERVNIKYVVLKSPTKNFEDMFQWLANDIAQKGILTERTLVYCQSRKHVGELYLLFSSLLAKEFHGYFDMYHTNTEADIQKKIISSFADSNGEIRVLFATIAFGLGIDVKSVYTVVMVGHPTDLDDLMQLSGRAGRDGTQSVSVLIDFPGAGAGLQTSDEMKTFLKGKTCRRKVIQDSFPAKKDTSVVGHNCCDICAQVCTCEEGECPCPCPHSEQQFKHSITYGPSSSYEMQVIEVSDTEIRQVTEQLEELRVRLLTGSGTHVYSGEDVACGFPVDTAEKIIEECHIVFPFDAFRDRYALSRRDIAQDAWTILNSCIKNYEASDVCNMLELEPSPVVSDEDVLEGEYAELGMQYSSESD